MNPVPDGYIPRLESKERECWKFLDWRLNSENDSRLHGQPSIVLFYFFYLFSSFLEALFDDRKYLIMKAHLLQAHFQIISIKN